MSSSRYAISKSFPHGQALRPRSRLRELETECQRSIVLLRDRHRLDLATRDRHAQVSEAKVNGSAKPLAVLDVFFRCCMRWLGYAPRESSVRHEREEDLPKLQVLQKADDIVEIDREVLRADPNHMTFCAM